MIIFNALLPVLRFAVKLVIEPFLVLGYLADRYGIEVTVYDGIDNSNLTSRRNGGIALLLEHLNDAFAERKPCLGIGIEIASELCERLKLPVLGV